MAKQGHKKGIIVETPPETLAGGVPFLSENDFRDALFAHGYVVTHEKAIRCGCNNKPTGQPMPNCCNCVGSGWFFVNKTETRMLVQGINKTTQYKDWTETDRGTASITARASDNILSFMDRVTVLDVESNFVESKKTRTSSTGEIFSFLYYYPLDIYAVWVWQGVDQPHRLLNVTEYAIEENKIVFDASLTSLYPLNKNNHQEDGEYLSFMIGYNYNPVFHCIDITREVVKNRNRDCEDGLLALKDFPVHAVAKKAHFILDAPEFDGSSVFDNSFTQEDLDACELILQRLTKEKTLTCVLPTIVYSDVDTQNAHSETQKDDITDWLCVPAVRNSLEFDGFNEVMTAGSTSLLRFQGDDEWSAAAWVKVSSLRNNDILGLLRIDGFGVGWSFRLRSDGKLQAYMTNGFSSNGRYGFVISDADVTTTNLNAWMHVAATKPVGFAWTSAKLLIDGVEIPSSGSQILNQNIAYSSELPSVGGSYSGHGIRSFQGKLFTARVWSRELSTAEMLQESANKTNVSSISDSLIVDPDISNAQYGKIEFNAQNSVAVPTGFVSINMEISDKSPDVPL